MIIVSYKHYVYIIKNKNYNNRNNDLVVHDIGQDIVIVLETLYNLL